MSADSVKVALPLFQAERSGAVPTSAHQLKFKTINYQTAMRVVRESHYLHREAPSTYSFGVYFDGLLMGVCNFGTPASQSLCKGIAGDEFADKVIELNRLWLDDKLPKNSESRFIGWCLRQLPKGLIVVSYADTGFGHSGVVYKATNWTYTGKTKERTDIYTGEGKHSRHYDKSSDYSKNRVKRTSKHRYVYLTDKELQPYIKYKTIDFPR